MLDIVHVHSRFHCIQPLLYICLMLVAFVSPKNNNTCHEDDCRGSSKVEIAFLHFLMNYGTVWYCYITVIYGTNWYYIDYLLQNVCIDDFQGKRHVFTAPVMQSSLYSPGQHCWGGSCHPGRLSLVVIFGAYMSVPFIHIPTRCKKGHLCKQ